MIFDEIMDELYNSIHILIHTRVELYNYLQYDPKYENYLLSPSLETQYSQSPYFQNVIIIMKLEHDTFKMILNIFQDRNHFYLYSVNLGISLSSMIGYKMNIRGVN